MTATLVATPDPARCVCGHYQAVHQPAGVNLWPIIAGIPERERLGGCTAGPFDLLCICDRFVAKP